MERPRTGERRGGVQTAVMLTLLGALIVALLLPASALAATWNVYSNGGSLAGKIDRWSRDGNCFVAYAPNWGADDDYGVVLRGDGADVRLSAGYLIGNVSRRSATVAVLVSPSSKVIGRARLVNGRWSLRSVTNGHFRTRGYVAKACPGRVAVGALGILVYVHEL
jgi:hypothetical protein